jgi:hypothetical protein
VGRLAARWYCVNMTQEFDRGGVMADKHMGVAEVKRRFADVVDEVMHGGRRIIVERRGQPVPPQHLGRLHWCSRPRARSARGLALYAWTARRR